MYKILEFQFFSFSIKFLFQRPRLFVLSVKVKIFE